MSSQWAAAAGDPLRALAAGLVLLAWAGCFITAAGERCGGLRLFRPRSGHWMLSLAVTGGLAIPLALLLWPAGPGPLLVGSLLLPLLGAELCMRRWPAAPDPSIKRLPRESLYNSRLYQSHHYTLFEPRPHIHSDSGLVHNRLGFRDHRALLPDPGAIRLVFVGGPTVYGVNIDDNAGLYTRLLEDRLNEVCRERLRGRRFEVINGGMANATSAEMLLRQIFAISEIRPALVAIQAGISDTWPRVASDQYFGDFRHLRKRHGHGPWLQPGLSVADSVTRALVWRSALLGRCLGRRVPAEPLKAMCNHPVTMRRERLAANPPVYFERNLKFMLALNQEMGARSLLLGDPIPVGKLPDGVYQRAVPEHNAVMACLAEARHVPYLDLGSALPLTDDIRVDDKYLNAQGQQRLASLIADFLHDSGLIDALLADSA